MSLYDTSYIPGITKDWFPSFLSVQDFISFLENMKDVRGPRVHGLMFKYRKKSHPQASLREYSLSIFLHVLDISRARLHTGIHRHSCSTFVQLFFLAKFFDT